MTYAEFIRRAVTVVAIVTVTVFVALALSRLSGILLIVFTCWVLSVGMNHAILKLRRWGMPKTLAMMATVAGIFVAIALVTIIIVPPFIAQATDLIESLPGAIEQIVEGYENLRANNPQVAQYLPEFTVENYRALVGMRYEEVIGENVPQPGGDGGAAFELDLGAIISSALPVLGGIGSFVGSILANLTLIILITGYLLFDPLVYYRPIIAIVPKRQEKRVVEIISKVREAVVSWMGALSISIAVTSALVTLALGLILQIPNSVALGVIAGLGTFIPNVGYYIGLIPIIIFTAVADPYKVIPAALIYWAINEFEGKFVAPNVIRNQLNIPAGVVLPFQLISAAVFGFFGILLAVPMLAIFIILWQELYVYDTLGKRDHMPELIETVDGELILRYEDEPMPDKPPATVDKPLATPRKSS